MEEIGAGMDRICSPLPPPLPTGRQALSLWGEGVYEVIN
jgi:hypothetical protein